LELLGRPAHTLNRALTKILPINDLDEAEYGKIISLKYKSHQNRNRKEYKYLNSIIDHLAKKTKKNFNYEVFIFNSYSPNAFAMPGGIIFVTSGLLKVLKTEAELTAILSHEIGHIELSHCLDRVKFEILSRKITDTSAGKIADFVVSLFFQNNFSKTQEAEADEYAYAMLLTTKNNPKGLGSAFNLFNKFHQNGKTKGNIIFEYIMTHPHTVLREEKYLERARVWWLTNPNMKRYNGEKNLKKLKSFYSYIYKDEWVDSY
jgi:predicted Zn-dependent protease